MNGCYEKCCCLVITAGNWKGMLDTKDERVAEFNE
jgi:hypothetical protein